MNYRREIDGLRAVAVLPVIFFHAGFTLFRGGFVGVDVFFVISGYLITSIIVTERQTENFTLSNFYERRARRILPPLILVTTVCLPFAWFWMLPDDLENFGQSLVATTLFSNNILLWLTTDYFALASEFKPLLHTWSLGVEEQYYLIFPIFLLMICRLGRRSLVALLALLLALSLGVAQWGTTNQPQATFYLLSARAWELLIGVFAAFYLLNKEKSGTKLGTAPSEFSSQLLSASGVFLIASSVFIFDKGTPFPGLYALIPTIGAVLVILFASPVTFVGKVLGSRILVGTGLVSYSAYLWHQPLFAFARINVLDEPSTSLLLILTVSAFVLAAASWRYIEIPFRNRDLVPQKTLFLLIAFLGLILVSIGWEIHVNSGFVNLWQELNTDIKAAGRGLNAAYNNRPLQFKNAAFKDANKKHILVTGNSFARDFINAGLENNFFSGSEISYIDAMPSCLNDAGEINGHHRGLIAQSDYLIFGSGGYPPACWKRDFELFNGIGAKKIIIIGTKNFGWNLNAIMRLDVAKRYSYRAKVLRDVWEENNAMARSLPNAYFVNQLAILADDDGRVPVFTNDKKIISQDRSHLTKDGAKFVGEKLFDDALLRQLK